MNRKISNKVTIIIRSKNPSLLNSIENAEKGNSVLSEFQISCSILFLLILLCKQAKEKFSEKKDFKNYT